MKSKSIILAILIHLISGCATHQEYLIFLAEDKKLILTATEISQAEKIEDIELRPVIRFYLTDKGTQKVNEFTKKRVGNTITIMYGATVLYNQLMVTTPIKTNIFSIPVRSKKMSQDIINAY